jgi:hypothetical protein
MAPRWRLLEGVVASLERSLATVEGTRVVPNARIPERVSSELRQVDVYLEVPVGVRTLRIGIEVKDEAAPLDLPDVEQLVVKLKKLDVDYGCVVSSSGFTGSALQEAKRNGVEVRTLAEIDRPSWWLASSLAVLIRRVELVNWQVNFNEPRLTEAKAMLAGVDGSKIDVSFASGAAQTLQTWVAAHGVAALERPELSDLIDQETFVQRIDFNDDDGVVVRCPSGVLPLPTNILAQYRLHVHTEQVGLSVFDAGDNVTAFTGVSNDWQRQVTLVTQLQMDGSRKISVSVGDKKPAVTLVKRRE